MAMILGERDTELPKLLHWQTVVDFTFLVAQLSQCVFVSNHRPPLCYVRFATLLLDTK